MRKPDRIEILETHEDAEQPYHLVKEIHQSTRIINGKEEIIETSRLTTKNIRPEGDAAKELSAKEKAEKKRKEDEKAAKETNEAVVKAAKSAKSKESKPSRSTKRDIRN